MCFLRCFVFNHVSLFQNIYLFFGQLNYKITLISSNKYFYIYIYINNNREVK